MVDNDTHGVVQPQEMLTAERRRSLTIGLPAGTSSRERRFPLTPEGAGILVDAGFKVKIEEGAAAPIHYTDAQYLRAGAEVTSRDSALACDIVLHLSPIAIADARRLKRGALLLTLLNDTCQEAAAVKDLLFAACPTRSRQGHTPRRRRRHNPLRGNHNRLRHSGLCRRALGGRAWCDGAHA